MSVFIEELKSSYISFIQKKIQFKELDNAIEITTPLLDRHNDYLQIFATHSGDGKLRLTDAGYIIDDLRLEGVDVFKSPKRKEFLEVILNSHGIACSETKELYVETSIEHFPQKKHMLIQAMLKINDMFMTAQGNVKSLFMEDVALFFEENDIRNTPNAHFVGKSGFTQLFDFVIPKSKISPERMVKTVNSINKQTASVIIFNWLDTTEVRGKESQLIVFANDATRKVSIDVITSLNEYQAEPILWSKRKDFIQILSA